MVDSSASSVVTTVLAYPALRIRVPAQVQVAELAPGAARRLPMRRLRQRLDKVDDGHAIFEAQVCLVSEIIRRCTSGVS
jgi:hypothetical protein